MTSAKISRVRLKASAAVMLCGLLFTAMSVDAKPRQADRWTGLPVRAQNALKSDPSLDRRIDQIVAGMTLRQKIGQMTQPDIRSIKPDEVRTYYIGSILNGGGAWPDGNKRASVQDWVALSKAYYDASMATDLKTPLPVIWGTDAVHGHNNVYGATLFPHNIGLGAARDPDLVGRIAHLTAKQVRATGITWAFAPTLAIVQNPRWGRTYEGYSSDPALVRQYAKTFVTSMQNGFSDGSSVVATAKHYVGDGGTWLGNDQGEAYLSRRQMVGTHMQGYFGALEADVQTVMISYSSWAETDIKGKPEKMHGQKELIDGVLKTRLGFDGLVVSDWNAIEQVPGCTRTRCPQAINAGVDLVMVPDDWKKFIDDTVEDVESGKIPMSRIDNAVARIIRVKIKSGLMAQSPFASMDKFQPMSSDLSNDLTRSVAREAVAKSLVLLKNNAKALPISRNKRILLVGKAADRITSQTGGWSLTWQGDETDDSDYPNADDMLSAVKAVLGENGKVDFSVGADGVDLSNYDAVIAVLAERPYAEMKGDIDYPASMAHSDRYPEDLEVLKKVSGKGVPVISVLYSGRPVYANDIINLSDAFVAAWLPGTEAKGITDVLFAMGKGKTADFTGRLPFAWPGVACPETAAKPVLFPRGFGLSYAKQAATRRLPEDTTKSCKSIAVPGNPTAR